MIEGFFGFEIFNSNFFFLEGGGGGRVGVGKFGKYFFGKGFLGGIQDSKFADTRNRDYGLLILSNEMKILVLQNVKLEFQQVN